MTSTPKLRRRSVLLGAAACSLGAIILPGRTARSSEDPRPRVVATTGILADLAKNVAGPDALVTSLIPEGGDPHSFEPLPRNVRDIAYADLALSNYLMLEEQALIRTIDANLPAGSTHLALAEEASTRGATIIPLVENRSLDTVWLGLRVAGRERGAGRLTQVRLALAESDGPGALHGYVTGTFGEPQRVFDASDGVSARTDAIDLPMDAHTHMSWAFTKAGVYRARFRGTWSGGALGAESSAEGDVWICVGISPEEAAKKGAHASLAKRQVISAGHADITVDVPSGALVMRIDDPEADGGTRDIALDDMVIHVPPKALLPVPADPAFRFIARGGTDVYQLPQAVLGKHVHGEIDPHLWQDVTNAQAYVEVIRDHLCGLDPDHAGGYRSRAATYLRELDDVDSYVQRSIDSIPKAGRELVTTHDAYGYLANRYGLRIAAVVSPSPGQEPSIADRRRLAATLRDLAPKAVFLEATAGPVSTSLVDAARMEKIPVQPIWGDSFTREVNTYAAMMRANADSLARGLGGKPLGDGDRQASE